ncbi:MAG: hypothetical protein OEQ13_12190, partial [Acidobacteriota bacterium]|nr:hypothetical protein [Acidobacteriota bacterium]
MSRATGRIRLLTAAAGLLLLVPLPGCAQDRPERADRVAVVTTPLEALQTGQYQAAVTGYRWQVRNGRDLLESARGWARALAATGDYEDALEALDEAEAAGADPAELAD